MKKKIVIEDWAGNILFEGNYDSPKVEKIVKKNDLDDLNVYWADENNEENVYEYIDF